MENHRIRVVFLDIGGVLLSNGWGYPSRQAAAREFGLDFTAFEMLHQFIFNTYEIGRISLDEYLDTVVFNQPRDFTKEAFRAFMLSQSRALPDLLPWLKAWKPNCGFRIYAINNEGRELNEYRVRSFGLHDCFDAFISSCEVGMRKPDPGIFSLALGVAQASPQECLYLDDRPLLVQAGLKAGIRSYQHTDPESTIRILEQCQSENSPKL